jgi:hypothetical protein
LSVWNGRVEPEDDAKVQEIERYSGVSRIVIYHIDLRAIKRKAFQHEKYPQISFIFFGNFYRFMFS